MMTIRKDSPFYGITDEQIDWLLELATDHDLCDVAEDWVQETGKEVHMEQMRRFLARAKRHRMLMDAEEAAGDMEGFAEAGKGGKLRDGAIEAARQRALEVAMEKGDSATLLELYKAANEERALAERAEIEKRKAAVAEENARIGWKKLELKRAEAALRLLPRLRALLEEGNGTAEEKLEKVREALGMEALGTERLLLVENCGPREIGCVQNANDKIQMTKE